MALTFSVEITIKAKQDVRGILTYITEYLNNPAAASRLSNAIASSGDSLAAFPKRYRVRKKDSNGHEIRYMPVGKRSKFMLIYFVDDSKKVVNIVRVLHETRNIDALI